MMGTEEEPGVTKQAIEQLFYAVEETPDRCFLMMVTSLSSAWLPREYLEQRIRI